MMVTAQAPQVGGKSLTYPLDWSAVLDSKSQPAVRVSRGEKPDNRRAGAGSHLHPVEFGSSGGASEYFAFEPG